jgi:hypothetical protein
MKKYLLTDACAGLLLLATICTGGFYYLDSQTKKIEQSLKDGIPAEVVKKGLHTQAEKTLFERIQKRTE